MKLIIASVLLVVSILYCVQTDAAFSADQVKAALQMATDACSKEITLTPDERKAALENKFYELPSPSKNIKCFARCFNQMITLLGENGQPNVNDFTTMMKNLLKDKADPKALLDKCVFDVKADPCDAAYDWSKCINLELVNLKIMM